MTINKGCRIENRDKTFYCTDCRACLHPKECEMIREQIGAVMFHQEETK